MLQELSVCRNTSSLIGLQVTRSTQQLGALKRPQPSYRESTWSNEANDAYKVTAEWRIMLMRNIHQLLQHQLRQQVLAQFDYLHLILIHYRVATNCTVMLNNSDSETMSFILFSLHLCKLSGVKINAFCIFLFYLRSKSKRINRLKTT